jgi:FG-GAP-like repeat
MMATHGIARRSSLLLLAATTAMACRPRQTNPTRVDAVAELAPRSSAGASAARPEAPPSGRCVWPPSGMVVATSRPALRVSAGVQAVELCRTRACDAPRRLPVGSDSRATPTDALANGTWFWRVAPHGASPPGPLWRFVVRSSKGRASRVHGLDLNGDGLADAAIDSAVLFGVEHGRFAPEFSPLPVAQPTSPSPVLEAPPRLSPSLSEPVGDIDGDGYDDAVRHDRIVRGGPTGVQPRESWFACPSPRCGHPAGDINGDGFADLFTTEGLQLGSPSGLTFSPSPLLRATASVVPAPDVDGDGIDDLVALSADRRTLSVLRGTTHGLTVGSTTSLALPRESGTTIDLAVADINGDGTSDIVLLIAEREAGKRPTLRVTVIARITGHGGDVAHVEERRVSWRVETPIAAEATSAELNVADVDGDGFDDLVVFVSMPYTGYGRLLHASAGALWLDPRPIKSGVDPTWTSALLSVGDMDGDGRDDLFLIGDDDNGFAQTFHIIVGSKDGVAPKPTASFLLSDGYKAPRSTD